MGRAFNSLFMALFVTNSSAISNNYRFIALLLFLIIIQCINRRACSQFSFVVNKWIRAVDTSSFISSGWCSGRDWGSAFGIGKDWTFGRVNSSGHCVAFIARFLTNLPDKLAFVIFVIIEDFCVTIVLLRPLLTG